MWKGYSIEAVKSSTVIKLAVENYYRTMKSWAIVMEWKKYSDSL